MKKFEQMTEEETIEQWQQTIKQWRNNLNEVSKHQKEIHNTFLDLCHYKGERFEEICSRILAFYLNPNEKHRFRDLWFKALCKTIQCDIDISQIEIKQEEYTTNSDENRRIDLVLKTPTSVIAIENKINAKLYNKLEKYRDHINNTYNYITEKNRLFYVLTAHKLSDMDKGKADSNNYIVINYNDLFENVKSSLDDYTSTGDEKYQYFMLDFMQTVKNRGKEMEITKLEKKFYHDYKKEIDEIISTYKSWSKKASKKIAELHEILKGEWEVYQNWILLIKPNKGKKYEIGIVSNFDFDDEDNPIGKFCIYITTWDMESWEPYENIIRQNWDKWKEDNPTIFKEFDVALDKGQRNDRNCVYLPMPEIELKNFENEKTYQDEIIKKLNEYYNFLKELTDNIDK